MAVMNGLTVPMYIRRAERLPDGRVKGYSPPRLTKRVVKHLSVQELMELQTVQEQFSAILRKRMQLLGKWGLDPRKTYSFNRNGEVTELGKWKPEY